MRHEPAIVFTYIIHYKVKHSFLMNISMCKLQTFYSQTGYANTSMNSSKYCLILIIPIIICITNLKNVNIFPAESPYIAYLFLELLMFKF